MKINIDEIVDMLDVNNDVELEELVDYLFEKMLKKNMEDANSNFVYTTMEELGIKRNNKKVYDMLMNEIDFDKLDDECGCIEDCCQENDDDDTQLSLEDFLKIIRF